MGPRALGRSHPGRTARDPCHRHVGLNGRNLDNTLPVSLVRDHAKWQKRRVQAKHLLAWSLA